MNDLKTGRLLTHWATRTVEAHRGESSFLLQKKQGVVDSPGLAFQKVLCLRSFLAWFTSPQSPELQPQPNKAAGSAPSLAVPS